MQESSEIPADDPKSKATNRIKKFIVQPLVDDMIDMAVLTSQASYPQHRVIEEKKRMLREIQDIEARKTHM